MLKYNWVWFGVVIIVKEEGFGVLYKGFVFKVFCFGFGGGIFLVVYIGVMDFFCNMREVKGF